MKEFLLEAFPNPERKGCPDEETLKALAEDRLPPHHSARLHVGSCSECFAEYRGYRLEWEDRKVIDPLAAPPVTASVAKPDSLQPIAGTHSPMRSWMLAASLLVLVGGGVLAFLYGTPKAGPDRQVASSQPINASVDLFTSGTLRGSGDDAAPLQEVSLSASIVHLSVVLPRFSEVGRYDVLVSKDKAGTQIVAMGAGNATEIAGKVGVEVTLDLRAARPGSYFLATVRGVDSGTYYYPLRIK